MVRAYLAHSSVDKAYVEKVALRLGRALVLYDRMCFEPGVDLQNSILDGLDKSTLFVFFVSKHSLASYYVKFEIEEADWRVLRDEMSGVLVIVIDKDVAISQLTDWMRRCLITEIGSPAQAARLIRRRLIEDSGFERHVPFVGRESDLKEFARQLIPLPEEEPSRLIVVSGLDGVGRRTFVRRALSDYLSLAVGPMLVLEETASLDMLHLWLLDEAMELTSRTEVAKALGVFRRLSAPEQGREIARLIAMIARNNQAPVIVDQNALLDDYGRYIEEFVYVVEGLKQYDDAYLVIIHRRRPDLADITTKGPGVVFQRVAPLGLEDTELLLRQTLRTADVEATNDQVRTLVWYMGGYPPAIQLASTYAKAYSLETLMADRATLSDFQVRTFAPVIGRLDLDDEEWDILRMLAGHAMLPLEAITTVLCMPEDACAHALRHLIDLNLVLPIEHQFQISPPVREAVNKVRGRLNEADYARIAFQLRRAYWSEPGRIPPLAIVDATIHALAHSSVRELAGFRDLVLPSQLYKVAKEQYNLQNWTGAIDFAVRTLRADPKRYGARIILCKAYVREERWTEAERELRKLAAQGVRAQFYCRGFLEWKRGNLRGAVSAFESALDSGDKSASVYRDLAHCLFRVGEIVEAKSVLSRAPEWMFGNRYVLDLAAQIAIAEGNWGAAEDYISALEHLASKEGFHYRRATLRGARKQWPQALADAEVACSGLAVRFEAMAQRIDILIELGRFPEADSGIEELAATTGLKRDVKTGLKCKVLLRQYKWQEAEVLWLGLHQRELPVQQSLRKEILSQKVEDPMTAPADREEAEEELERIGEPFQMSLAMSEEDAE